MSIAFKIESLFVLAPIFLLSMGSIFIIIERLIYFKKLKKKEEFLYLQLKPFLQNGNFEDSLKICHSVNSPLSRLAQIAIENRNQKRDEIKELVSNAANTEIPLIEKFISALGTISHIAPLLGLLGTVTGNIKAFGLIGGGGSQNYELLAPAIGEALYTTAGGIMVAIPAIIFYNYFVNRANLSIMQVENRINDLVCFLGD